MDPEWVLVTLRDVQAALEEVIDDVEGDPERVEQLLSEQMPAVFAKLNYAWNTRYAGPTAIDTTDHDALVAWPEDVEGL